MGDLRALCGLFAVAHQVPVFVMWAVRRGRSRSREQNRNLLRIGQARTVKFKVSNRGLLLVGHARSVKVMVSNRGVL